MSALARARDHYVSRYAEFERGAGDEPAWLRSLRREALAHFEERGLPDRKQEEWRYTNLAALAGVPFELAPPAAPPPREAVEPVAFPVYACGLAVFVDGRHVPELSATRALSGDLRVLSLAALRAGAAPELEGALGRQVDTKRHPFAALNTAFLDDGAAVFLPAGVALEQPLHVVFVSTGGEAPRVQHPRLLLVAGANSRATVIQDHVSIDAARGTAAGFTNAVTEVRAEPGARLDLVLLQRESDRVFHVSNLSAHQERDSRLSAHTITLGGALVRNDANVLLAGEGAECRLSGLYVGSGRQVLDNHTEIDHAVPHGTSHELYKGILGGHSRGVFRGRVVVRPDAQKTLASQSNPNLLLSEGAEIDTKPQLEIYADDVKCSHGSAIGQLDETALFYLRSRGLGEERARQILTRAFANEILHALPLPPLAEELSDELADRLQAGSAS